MSQHSSGALTGFLKIDNIRGEVTQKGHEGWIDVQSVQWSAKRSISSPAGGASREASAPSISELVITKKVDSTSPPLFLNAVGGSAAIPTVKLELTASSPTGIPYLFYRLTLTDVMVSSLSQAANDGDDSASESVSLNFSKIKIEYFKVDSKGVTTPITPVEYDLANGK